MPFILPLIFIKTCEVKSSVLYLSVSFIGLVTSEILNSYNAYIFYSYISIAEIKLKALVELNFELKGDYIF